MNIIDISVGLEENMPSWPGSCGFKLSQTSSLEHGDLCNGSQLTMDAHVGTHIDAPWHFLAQGKTVEQVNLSQLIGPAYVAWAKEATEITSETLHSLNIPDGVKRLLLRTKNSMLWERRQSKFKSDFVALRASAAQWLVERGVQLVGIDYLSIQMYQDPAPTHEILLKSEIVVLEGLNLNGVDPGDYELMCLPLKIIGSDGAPARAVLCKK